jgi:transcription elongation GreA/GreB family factor
VSKAFTRESDDGPEPVAQRRGVPVPDPNYMTPAGARAARSELATCHDDARIRELTDHLATAQIIEPPSERIVGALEADARHGLVFWQSPIAARLYGGRVGDSITLPRGGEAEIVAIAYE